MAKQGKSDDGTAIEPRVDRQPGMERRQFLQVGLLGGAAAAAGVIPTVAEPVPTEPAPEPHTDTTAQASKQDDCKGRRPQPAPLECQVPNVKGALENWNEPWVWRPGDWPGQQLDLNVVINQNPGIEVGLGNPGSIFFSFGGNTPGPTIRMRGDETLSVKLRNLLSEDFGENFVGPFPDLGDLPLAKGSKPSKVARPPVNAGCDGPVNVCDLKPLPVSPCESDGPSKPSPQKELEQLVIEKGKQRGQHRFDFCLGEHTNGLHSAHVTNMHTHGLHVRPDKNPDGTNSDNVILRVLSQGDFKRRERAVMGEPGERCICNTPSSRPVCKQCGGSVVEPSECATGEGPVDPTSACRFLRRPEQTFFIRDDEIVGEADYEFRLGNVMGDPNQPHPPGTFWYHPHAHGATDIQVSSGMAGYLIIEGAEDDNINCRLTGIPNPNPSLKTGPWDYRERLMFMQRVFPTNTEGDPDAAPKSRLKKVPTPTANGSEKAGVINMRRGAVERWRVLNGSVDGRGYKRFMVVKGHYDIVTTGFAPTVAEADVPRPQQAVPINMLVKIGPDNQPILKPVTPPELEAAKCHLFQLSIDGITLVRTVEKGGKQVPEYYIKDLAKQIYQCPAPGPGGPSPKIPADLLGGKVQPMCRNAEGEEVPVNTPNARKLRTVENVFKNADTIRNAWVRPNEFYMGPANRTDVFFQLPPDAKCGDIYTVLAKAVAIHADTPVFSLQESVNCPNPSPGPSDIIVAHIVVVSDDLVDGVKDRPKSVPIDQTFDHLMMDVQKCLPEEVLPYLHPITDEELAIRGSGTGSDGKYRTRVSYYSGWGNEGLPLVTTDPADPSCKAFSEFIEGKNRKTPNGPELRDLRYMWVDENGNAVPAPKQPSKSDIAVLLSPRTRTMGINHGTQPSADDKDYDHHLRGRKFNPGDSERPFVLVNTCEEWAVYNTSQTLWGYTDTSEAGEAKHPQPGQFRGHYVSYPITRREGQDEFWRCENLDTESGIPDFRVVSRAIDHPFHIHQNPFWVLRIEIPDENGKLVNILPEPRWMDTSWIPRNNGRIVFRSRFPDYVGIAVHHCHILQHEDNGMMTAMQLTPFPELANPEQRQHVADGTQPCEQSPEDVDKIYPRPTLEESYIRNFTFLDSNIPAAKDPSLPPVYIAPKPGAPTRVPNTGQNYPGFKVEPPSWPPAKRKSGEKKSGKKK